MGRLRLATGECSYQEIDRQIKDQFIYGLNDTDMLAEIIRQLTKTLDVTNEQALVWAKRVEAQKAQSMIITSLSEIKDFNKIKTEEGWP